MSDNEATPGFDRRSLIKQGLVGAGIAVTAPVISTFNTAAFAVSIPGCHKTQFKITPQNPNQPATIVQEVPTSAGCDPDDPDYAGATVGVINPLVTATGPGPGNIYTFTLDPEAEGCVFEDASANKTSTDCIQAPAPSFTGLGTTVLTFDRDALGNDQGEFHVRLLICCDPP
jgi:hypothetical protein